MQITRTYFNSNSETIRIDEIWMDRRMHRMIDGVDQPTYARYMKATKRHNQATYGPTDRVVDVIELEGDFDAVETSSGNYTWATWSFGGGDVKCDMSDLPAVGDSV